MLIFLNISFLLPYDGWFFAIRWHFSLHEKAATFVETAPKSRKLNFLPLKFPVLMISTNFPVFFQFQSFLRQRQRRVGETFFLYWTWINLFYWSSLLAHMWRREKKNLASKQRIWLRQGKLKGRRKKSFASSKRRLGERSEVGWVKKIWKSKKSTSTAFLYVTWPVNGKTGPIYRLLPYPAGSLFYSRDHKFQMFYTKLDSILGRARSLQIKLRLFYILIFSASP